MFIFPPEISSCGRLVCQTTAFVRVRRVRDFSAAWYVVSAAMLTWSEEKSFIPNTWLFFIFYIFIL